jgi:PadR family transcriptional regulator, regulatory protein PadR
MSGMTDETNRKQLYGNLEMLVLAALTENPMHGYLLRQALAARTREVVQVSYGRLYPLLAALARRREVTCSVVKAGESREQRVYAITGQGRRALAERVRAWRRFASAVEALLAPGHTVRPHRSPVPRGGVRRPARR